MKQVERRELSALVDDNDYVAALFLDAGQQFRSDRMAESLAKVVLPKMQVGDSSTVNSHKRIYIGLGTNLYLSNWVTVTVYMT